ncbi:MAG: ribonuclease HIII [Firmicutes bacterium]|nr:ribonuclease HIII [Bacillota bacterium]
MKHFSMPVNDNELKKLHKLYQHHLIDDDNQYLVFHAKHNETHVLAYATGKVLLQGEEITSELILIKKHLNKIDYAAIGSDEVGTGDVFGPVVVCTAFVSKEDIPYLEQMGVKDSKNISDDDILTMGSKLAQKLTHTLLIVKPSKYNELTSKSINLNKMKALLHNQAIIKITSKLEKEYPVIVDQFCQPNLYYNYLSEETLVYRNINFYTKAESVHLAVAAASIIARYAFLLKMKELSTQVGFELRKGASSLVDDQIEIIVEKHGVSILSDIAKLNFKNITKRQAS